ncbi:hypothetical protein EVAR_75884_1 [Eumeta japonica]|uniref:Uncharacterized protein n=1 Tax=Eumeta variegata TaxID=151549 RepID=A0A4C1UVZ3_EUMVA|nr:hypothetical protein EVAR_75884_1 [Eumeta japonica]
MMNNVIEATILTGKFKGEDVLLPRIPKIPTNMPFEFKRLQFPVRLAFAMTINKAQGQSLQAKSRPVAPPRDLNNFPDLAGNKPTPAAASPRLQPVGKPKPTLPPRAAPGPWRSCPPRATRVAPRFRDRGHHIVGDDIQTVMSILRAVKSSEISEFARFPSVQ